MSQRRSKLDIQLEVLKAVRGGMDKPTRIMYAANLAWSPLNKILEFLVESELLSEINIPAGNRSKRRYEITEKGVSVLNYMEGAKELIDII
jgi:predicted transcriptional regulator